MENSEEFEQQLDYKMNIGHYKQIAQKLDKHLQDIYEADQSQKNRWVWQLIQNAKDTPNQLNHTKIKIEVDDNQMRFMHNANPFSLDDLISLVQQFSSKTDKNNEEDETTGKYGTGFITTHMISRIIVVKGVFQYMLKDQISRIRNFEITLDREYQNRDTDLVEKVARNMYQLKNLKNSTGKIKQKRDQNAYETIFIYKNLDQTALGYIDAGLQDLKKSSEYTLLFNKKIESIQIIDLRNNKKKQTVIKRAQEFNYKGLTIFKSLIETQQDNVNQIVTQRYLIFKENPTLCSIVAMPVSFDKIQNKLTILKIQNNVPRIFKQFPLIGTQKWGFNYVCTCKFFYPNQRRSGLRLKLIEGRPDKKVIQNRENLQKVISQVQIFYKTISLNIMYGLGNLAISSFDCNHEYKDFIFNNIYLRFRKFIQKLNFVKLENTKLVALQNLIFPIFQHSKVKIAKKHSIQLYNQFKYLNKNLNIDQEEYQILYDSLTVDKGNWKKVKFSDIFYYIKKIQQMGVIELKKLLQTQFLITLKKLYAYLQKRFTTFVQQSSKYKIVLNQNGNFDKLSNLRFQQNLPQIFKQYAIGIGINIKQELIDNQIKQFFETRPYFNVEYCTKRFGQCWKIQDQRKKIAEKQFKLLFNWICTFRRNDQNQASKNKVKRFGVKLNPYDDDESRRKIFNLITRLKMFENYEEIFITEHVKINYKYFILKFFSQILEIIQAPNVGYLKDLKNIVINNDQSEIIDFLDNYKELVNTFELNPEDQFKIDLNKCINYNGQFMGVNQLYYMKQNISRIELDIYNYNIQHYKPKKEFKNHITKITSDKELEEILLHDRINPSIWNLSKEKQMKYQEIFKPVVKSFEKINQNLIFNQKTFDVGQKQQIQRALKYVKQLLNLSKIAKGEELSIIKGKLKVFKSIADKRIELAMALKNFTDDYKTVIYELIEKQQQFLCLTSMLKRYNSFQNVQKRLDYLQLKNKDLEKKLRAYDD